MYHSELVLFARFNVISTTRLNDFFILLRTILFRKIEPPYNLQSSSIKDFSMQKEQPFGCSPCLRISRDDRVH